MRAQRCLVHEFVGAVREPPEKRRFSKRPYGATYRQRYLMAQGNEEIRMAERTRTGYRHRRSIRLPGYDYSQPGAYFVTVCVHGGRFLFGDVMDGRMRLNATGDLVQVCWEWLEQQYRYVELDEYVIMPNHVHGIIILTDLVTSDGSRTVTDASDFMTLGGSRTAPREDDIDSCRGASRSAPTLDYIRRKPLGRIIGAFKTVSTKRINELSNSSAGRIWQRGFFEHVIRGERDLTRIREYISTNPRRWHLDRDNPEQTGVDSLDKWLGAEGARPGLV